MTASSRSDASRKAWATRKRQAEARAAMMAAMGPDSPERGMHRGDYSLPELLARIRATAENDGGAPPPVHLF
jgi:hypothetical protein